MKKIITGDENLLNVFLSRKQGIYAGTDIVHFNRGKKITADSGG